jgi:hypothetical protein
MIIHDLFFDSGSTEAAKIKKILQRYVIYISDHITVTYLNIETGNRQLLLLQISDWNKGFFLVRLIAGENCLLKLSIMF